jgi:hypothetical protein
MCDLVIKIKPTGSLSVTLIKPKALPRHLLLYHDTDVVDSKT